MWVRLAEWMIGEFPNLKAGCPLLEIGVRMRGVVTPARPDTPNEMATVRAGRPHEVVYGFTGQIVGAPRDVDTGSRHLGVEFAVAIGPDRYQVQTEGWARDVATGSRVFASGRLEIIADYEFDGFQLIESRANWLVQSIEPLGNGDLMIDLEPSEG